jgi:hypothetical protein
MPANVRDLSATALKGLFTVVLGLQLGCGAGKGSGGRPQPKYDVSGTWSVQEGVATASGVCSGSVGRTNNYTITIEQDAAALTVTVSALPGTTFHGTISGDRVTWSGSFREDEGTTTFTDMDLRVDSTTTYSGTVSWRWSGGGESCTGTTEVSGSRPDPVKPYGGTESTVSEADCKEACGIIQGCFAQLDMSECMSGCAESFANASCEACLELTNCNDIMPCIGDHCGAPVDEWNWQTQ